MRRTCPRLRTVLVAAFGLALFACAGPKKGTVGEQAPPSASPQAPNERLLWSSLPHRPAWTLSEPEPESGFHFFVGISGDYATENLARDDALRSATTRAVQYMGTLAKDRFERARTSFGLSSTVVDPTEASRQFERQLSAAAAKQLKPKEWYLEQWQKPTGYSFRAFLLARMPKAPVDESLRTTADDNLRKAQDDARAAATQTAKRQAEDAAEFWQKMKDQGFTE